MRKEGQKPGEIGQSDGQNEGQVSDESKRRRKKGVPPDRVSDTQSRRHAIGLELQRMFQDVINEEVPVEFLEILKQIDRKSHT